MKFFIAFIAFALIATASCQKAATAKPPTTQDPIQAAASQMAGYINSYTGTSDALTADLTSKAKNEKGSYSSTVIANFISGVCAQLASNSKISCSAFTSIVKTNYKASN